MHTTKQLLKVKKTKVFKKLLYKLKKTNWEIFNNLDAQMALAHKKKNTSRKQANEEIQMSN